MMSAIADREKIVIGITGRIASGKDTAGEYISNIFGIELHSITDPLKERACQMGLPLVRDSLIKVGNLIAGEFGSDYLAKVLLGRIERAGVIIGLRQIDQITYLRANSKFTLISIEATDRARFDRACLRGKPGDELCFDEFNRTEIEKNSGSYVQRVFDCMALADIVIHNDGNKEDFFKALHDVGTSVLNNNRIG